MTTISTGRRSLLLRATPHSLQLASVAPQGGQHSDPWLEVPPGLYCLQLCDPPKTIQPDQPTWKPVSGPLASAVGRWDTSEAHCLGSVPWRDPDLAALTTMQRNALIGDKKEEPLDPVATALELLQQAVALRCALSTTGGRVSHPPQRNLPPPLTPPAPLMVLFSGGVDSTILAALTHRSLPPGALACITTYLCIFTCVFKRPLCPPHLASPEAPIDLVSICFDGGRSPDRHAALDALEELQAMAPTRMWRLLLVNATLEDLDTHRCAATDVQHGCAHVLAGSGCCSCCTRHTLSWTSTSALRCGLLLEGRGTCMATPPTPRHTLRRAWCCWGTARTSCVVGMGVTARSFGCVGGQGWQPSCSLICSGCGYATWGGTTDWCPTMHGAWGS